MPKGAKDNSMSEDSDEIDKMRSRQWRVKTDWTEWNGKCSWRKCVRRERSL